MIWSDIKNLNLSYEIDKIVISDNYEYWLGDKSKPTILLMASGTTYFHD